jgi:hypothetical protein
MSLNIPTQNVIIPRSAIPNEIKCLICLDVIHNAHVIQECFHRFCGECIRKCNFVKNECPACTKKIKTHRSLKPDITFDKIIKALVPDISWNNDNNTEVEKINLSEYRQQHKIRSENINSIQREKRKLLTQTMVEPSKKKNTTTAPIRTSTEIYVALSLSVQPGILVIIFS